MATAVEAVTPLLRWAGSKKKLLPHLLESVPSEYDRYVEPFAGSCCLFFALRPAQAILGDINHELMSAYGVIRKHPRLVYRALCQLSDNEKTYYRLRSLEPCSLSSVDRAVRFVYLNRYCFNGVYRINRTGAFNVPRGTKTGSIPTEHMFWRCSIALRKADIRIGDYRDCLRDVRRGDFVYLDPPYASKRRNTYGEYGYGCFHEHNLPVLIAQLRVIDCVGATFLLSYSPHASFRNLPKQWHTRELKVRRHVAGFAKHRHLVSEVLVSNRPLTSFREDGNK